MKLSLLFTLAGLAGFIYGAAMATAVILALAPEPEPVVSIQRVWTPHEVFEAVSAH